MTEGCSFVICQALHTTGWLVRFLALLLRTSSLGKHGAGSCFGALPYPVYPNQTRLGQFQNTERPQFAIGPGKVSSAYIDCFPFAKELGAGSQPIPSLQIQIILLILLFMSLGSWSKGVER